MLISHGALADDELWALLKRGGQVVLIRHTLTTPGVGDPEGMRLEDCSTQRNLSEEGREHARRIGAAFRSNRIAIDRVLTSPWCRCVETAGLAFGKAEISHALGNLFDRQDQRQKQVAEMSVLVAEKRAAGTRVLVSHGSTILALTRISPAPGEIVVVTPRGGGSFAVAGRFTVP
jgi:broad specificity phosphatase PhoE